MTIVTVAPPMPSATDAAGLGLIRPTLKVRSTFTALSLTSGTEAVTEATSGLKVSVLVTPV